MSEIEKKWYVLRAVSGKESKVKDILMLTLRTVILASMCLRC